MTELVISSAIEHLEVLLDEKAASLQGAEEQLEGLKTDLTLMLDFLTEPDRRRRRAHNLHHLISQVTDMANDTGVIIDTFVYTKSEELETVRLNNFLREIESIRSGFREVNLQSQVGVVEEEEEDVGLLQELAPWESDANEYVVGLEDLVESLIRYLVSSDKNYIFQLRISGMGGIGKTILARQVYNNAAVVEKFECRGWACLSDESKRRTSAENVLRVLIRQVIDLREEKEVMEEMDVETMQQMLRRHLHDKTYFIVLDDVWDDTCAKYVLPCLPENDSSRVLLTARSSSITKEARIGINMSYRNSRQSWQLFMKVVFNGYYKCPKHLEKIGRKIVKKCNGLPLAIKEAGMQLARLSQSESVWQAYLESMNLSVTAKILELSYHRLSPKLKSCFVHMSFFKEGKDIRAVKLFHIWNFARMVRQCKVAGNEILMEETARIYLSYLSDDNMIMNKHSTMYGKIKSFDVDDFLHKISILKAEQEISFEILRNEEHCGPLCKPRHRAIYCSRERFNNTTNQDKYLLSLFLHGFGSFDASPSYWENFEQLRILDFEGFGLKTLPEMVCALGRLRYLGLRDNHIQELSHTLVRLKNLEVLDIAHNFMIEVPDIIFEMDSLCHLYMSDIICRTPLMIDSLKNLQSLKYISVNNWMHELSNLGKMTSLRKLGIHELDENTDIPRLFASLAKLKSLEYLILRGFCFRSMPPLDDFSGLYGLIQIKLIGRLTRLPKFPQNIRSVRLVNSCLPQDAEKEVGVEGSIHQMGTNMRKDLYYQY